ncbi:MAG: DUF72 domain-containing protein [Chloroflexota bacterium]
MGEILIGTCSWADPTLLMAGTFYPSWAKGARARLEFYSSEFRLVEVDSSYYALPSQDAVGDWARWTPGDFVFDVKAFRLFTCHPTPAPALPRDIREGLGVAPGDKKSLYVGGLPQGVVQELWHRFEDALLPLDSAGKLGVVAFQFPSWFLPDKANRGYVSQLRERLPQYRLAVEFRSGAWLDEERREETFALLSGSGLSFVCVDGPQGFRSSVPPLAEATSEVGVVRFHGRNRETWERRGIGAAGRFNYRYSEVELAEWVPRIIGLSARTRQLHVLFNNCHEDKAVVNARQMGRILSLPLRVGSQPRLEWVEET